MPLVNINIAKGRDKQFLNSLISITMDCVIDALKLPSNDRNIRLTEYEKNFFYLKPPYSMVIEISMFSGRTAETKKKLYQSIVSKLFDSLKIQKEEVFIIINEQPKENWGIRGGIPANEIDLGFEVEI